MSRSLNQPLVIALQMALLFGAALQAIPLPAQEPSSPRIGSLVRDLDSTDYQVRQKAYERLIDLDEALPILRGLSTFATLESRRRVEQLIKLHIVKRGLRRVHAIIERKAMAEIDLLVDACIQNRPAVDKDAWRFIAEQATAIWNKNRERTAVLPPSSVPTCLSLPLTDATSISNPHAASCRRVLCTSLALQRPLSRAFLLCGGGCTIDDAILNSVVLANGPIDVHAGGPGSAIIHSLVFADGDVACEEIRQSVVIATGRIKCAITRQSALYARVSFDSAPVRMFDLCAAGLTLRAKDATVVIDSVGAGTVFQKAGLRAGDVVTKINGIPMKAMLPASRALRAGLASAIDLELSIKRDKAAMRITVANPGR